MTVSLIDIYIQEVARRLPEKSREDIGLELRSTIEDMLPDDYTEEDVKSVLEKLGNPAMLASRYRDQPMHLIGPRYFDVYVTLLKMILPIAAVISLISMIAENFFNYGGHEAVINVFLIILSNGIWKILEVSFQTFFWLTIVFAIIERTDKGKDTTPLSTSLKLWTPDDLKKIVYIPKKRSISKVEVFGSFMWTAIWATVYFYADQLVGIYKGNGDGLHFVTPTFNQEVLLNYWPIVLVAIVVELALTLYKSIKWKWTKKLAIFNTVKEMLGTIIFIVIVSNPNVFHPEFISFMANLFDLSTEQFHISLVGGVISIFVIAAAFNVYDGFRKSRSQ